MTTTVFLVRHAHHVMVDRMLVGRNQSIGLSRSGLCQAERLADCLARLRVASVQSSPQLRARQTAQPIAALARMPFLIAPDLEEIDAGDWTGCTFDELAADPAWRRWNDERATASIPNGDDMERVQGRIVRYLQHLAKSYSNRRVVAVTHAEIIRTAILLVRGLALQEFARVRVDPASITILRLGKDSADIVVENQSLDVLVAA